MENATLRVKGLYIRGTMKFYEIFICFVLCLFSSLGIAQTRVIFINPGFVANNPTGPFWQNVSTVMDAAAKDLDIALKIHYANRDHIQMKKLVLDALNESPDFLVLVDEKSAVTKLLLSSPPSKTKIYFLLNTPTSVDLERLTRKGFNVVGSVIADNTHVGKALITSLIEKAKQSKGTIIALYGDTSTQASILRERGMLSVINRQHGLKLRERLYANWSELEAYRLTHGLAQRYPDLSIVWAANDAMAAGADRALNQLGIREKVAIGGINWDPQIEQLDISFGGHFMLGAYALIELINLQDQGSLVSPHKELPIFVPYNENYQKLLHAIYLKQIDTINFRVFTNSADSTLPFNMNTIRLEFEKNF